MITTKNTRTLYWTVHVKLKMKYYGLSEARIKRIIHAPQRIEEGIAPKTKAMMQSAGSKKNPYELWAMVQDVKGKRKIISAWRYPGVTKPGQPLPPDIIEELKHWFK